MDIAGGRVKKGIGFKNLRDAGDPVELAKFYCDNGADELVILDITATIESRKNSYKLVADIAKNINIPLTVGGGVKNMRDIKKLLNAGADKVSIGTQAVLNPNFVNQAVKQFGSQCIVISIDPKQEDNSWKMYIRGGRDRTNINAVDFCQDMEKRGAGELLINSLDRDGTKQGYDIKLLKTISRVTNLPIIASSGAGKKEDFLEVFKKTDVSAVLAAGIFHYQKLNIQTLKKYLLNNKINIRV